VYGFCGRGATFVLLTGQFAHFREDFDFILMLPLSWVEIFGGESLAAPWALPATPLQAADTPTRPPVFFADHMSAVLL
jgi:hypothetical protein